MSEDRHKDPTRADYMYRAHLENKGFGKKYSAMMEMRQKLSILRVRQSNIFAGIINGILKEDAGKEIGLEIEKLEKKINLVRRNIGGKFVETA